MILTVLYFFIKNRIWCSVCKLCDSDIIEFFTHSIKELTSILFLRAAVTIKLKEYRITGRASTLLHFKSSSYIAKKKPFV